MGRTIVAAALGFLAFYAPGHALEKSPIFASDNRIVKLEQRLRVNTDNQFRVVVNKCEAEGEADLHRLAHDAEFEESFIFLPKPCLWIETGAGEERSKEGKIAKLYTDFTLPMKVISEHPDAIPYHFHSKAKNFAENTASFSDLKYMANLYAEIFNEGGAWHARHRVVTPFGRTEISFTNQAAVDDSIRNYEKQFPGLGAEYFQYHVRRDQSVRADYYASLKDCVGSNKDATISFQLKECASVKTDLFTLIYRMHKN